LIVVYLLATLPEYHRRGLGKQLMDVCLQDADAAQAKAFLIATEAGSVLYRKLGFKEVDGITFDVVPHGGDEKVTWLCMLREPM
jgi:ribosomal protein S18 acetylase RimI-like enzyme